MRALLLGALAFVPLPAAAAAPPAEPQVVDVANDANGTAGPSSRLVGTERQEPTTSQKYADLRSVRITTTKTTTTLTRVVRGRRVTTTVTTPTGFTVALEVTELQAAPADSTVRYQVLGMVDTCGVAISHDTAPPANATGTGTAAPQTYLRLVCGGAFTYFAIPAPQAQGNTLTWTVSFAALEPAARAALPLGAQLYRLEAQTTVHPKAHSNGNGVVLDVTPAGRSYVIGE